MHRALALAALILGSVAAAPTYYGNSVSSTVPTANIVYYGADKTGVSDSTSAITAAEAAVNAAGGGIVYAPAGTYKISNVIWQPSNIVFQGAGRDQTTIVVAANFPFVGGFPAYPVMSCGLLTGSTITQHLYPKTAHGKNAQFRDFTLDLSNVPTSSVLAGLSVTNCDYSVVERVHVKNDPGYSIATNVTGPPVSDGYSYVILGLRIRDNLIENSGRGTGVDGIGGGWVKDEIISGNTCVGASGTCIDQVMVLNSVWSNNSSYSPTLTNGGALASDFGADGLTISGNFLTASNIRIYGGVSLGNVAPQRIKILHNNLPSAATAGIQIDAGNQDSSTAYTTKNNTIADNYVGSAIDQCFSFGDMQFSVVVGNICDGWVTEAIANTSMGNASAGAHFNEFLGNTFIHSGSATVYTETSGGFGNQNIFANNNLNGVGTPTITTDSSSSGLGVTIVRDNSNYSLTLNKLFSTSGGVQPNGTSGGYASEFFPLGIAAVHPQVVTGSCASVANAGTVCTFPNSFAFGGTTYQCQFSAEGATPHFFSYDTKTTTTMKVYSDAGTPTADYVCSR